MRKILIVLGLPIILFSCSNPNNERPSEKVDNYTRENKIILGERADKLPKDRHFYSAFVLVKSLDVKKIQSEIKSFYKGKGLAEKDSSILFSVVNNWVLLKIPESYSFGDIAFLITWIEQDLYAIFIDMDNSQEDFYFTNTKELSKEDCILGHFKSGESFKVYVPDASWGGIMDNSYQVKYSMDNGIINQLDSIIMQKDKISFRTLPVGDEGVK